LENVHLNLLSFTTNHVLKMLKENPSYDMMNQMFTGLPLLK